MPCSLWFIGDLPPDRSASKGDLIGVFPPMRQSDLGIREQPPRIVRVNITDRTQTQLLSFMEPVAWDIDYQVLSHDPVTDTYQVRASQNVIAAGDVSGLPDRGRLSQAKIGEFLQNWQASVVGTAINQVDFDASIYDALRSQGFFKYPQATLDQVTWSETYDQGTGVHTVTANYAGLPVSPAGLEKRVRNLGLTVVDHVLDEIIFEGDRTTVFTEFKKDVSDKLAGRIAQNFVRYAITPADVDAINAAGGEVDRTLVQASLQIIDRLA